MKLCSDCIHAKRLFPKEETRPGYWQCTRFVSVPSISPVDGSVVEAANGMCAMLRRNNGICGKSAMGWSSRHPAKAIEAGTGETERLDPQGESAVPQGFAQETQP